MSNAALSISNSTVKKPIILFFGAPEFVYSQVVRELKSSPFEFIRAKDFIQIHEAMNSRRLKVGLIFDQSVKDPKALIDISKKLGDSKWILFTRDPQIYSKDAANIFKGFDFVMDYPIMTAKLIGRIKAIADEAFRLMNLSEIAEVAPTKIFRAGGANPIVGFEQIVGNSDFALRRSWIPLGQKLFNEVSGSSGKLRDLIQESLRKVFSDMNEIGRLSVVSFGVDSPYLGGAPDKFVILSSSDYLSRSIYEKSFLCNGYPELLEAVRLQKPVFAPDVRRVPAFQGVLSQIEKSGSRSLLAIPLMNSYRPFAILKARLPFVQDKQVLELLSDLSSYTQELSPFISYYDFFSRTYRGMNK